MRVKVSPSLSVDLAPFTKDEAQLLIENGGIQLHSITRYMSVRQAFTSEDEHAWYEHVRTRKDGYTWGIWVIEGEKRRLIGNTTLFNLKEFPARTATSGSVIVDKAYWGKGIASALHKARTWYSFAQLDLDRIDSEVVQANIGSRKALEKSGYFLHSLRRNAHFADGRLHHMDVLECLNPREDKWLRWWGDDVPTPAAIAARKTTNDGLKWSEKNVELL